MGCFVYLPALYHTDTTAFFPLMKCAVRLKIKVDLQDSLSVRVPLHSWQETPSDRRHLCRSRGQLHGPYQLSELELFLQFVVMSSITSSKVLSLFFGIILCQVSSDKVTWERAPWSDLHVRVQWLYIGFSDCRTCKSARSILTISEILIDDLPYNPLFVESRG
jgi:hypothetical protein